MSDPNAGGDAGHIRNLVPPKVKVTDVSLTEKPSSPKQKLAGKPFIAAEPAGREAKPTPKAEGPDYS